MNGLYADPERMPWLKYYSEEALEADPPEGSMIRFLRTCCEQNDALQLPAFNYYGKKTSYKAFFDMTDRYAAAFLALGVRPGDHVSFVTVVLPETIEAFYGLNRIGAVANFIDPRTDAPHTHEFIRKAKSKVVIVIENMWHLVADLLPELNHVIVQSAADSLAPVKKQVMRFKMRKIQVPCDGVQVMRTGDFIQKGHGQILPEDNFDAGTGAAITRTGGTTGVSKGVILTNGGMNALGFAAANAHSGVEPGDKILNFLPIAASYGICCGVHLAMCVSCEEVLIPLFKPEDFPDLIYKYRPNVVVGVPMFYEKLLHDRRFENLDLSFLKVTLCGGDSPTPTMEADLERFFAERHASCGLCTGYGLSECTSAVCVGFGNYQRKGSVGLPIAFVDMAIFEPDTGKMLPIGEIGEICVSGPCLMSGYLNEPEETAHIMRLHGDGKLWIHTGDLGCFDDDGFVYIKGRIKRSIIRFDGHKNYPVQLEALVATHPDVALCAVIPVQDRAHDHGDLPLIIARPNPEYTGTYEQLSEEIMALCAKGIEGRSQPAAAIVVDQLPVNNMQKVDLKKLSEEYYHYHY